MLSWGVRSCGHRRIASGDLLADNLPEGSGPRGALRVIRGGSRNTKPRNVRSTNQNRNEPDNRNNNLGFRLAQSTRAACAVPGADPFTDGSGVVRGYP